jgi:AcrR family transcriptional regulator
MAAGARSLKTCGFNGIGVDGLAAAVGVTSGAFYSNVANKEAMLEAVVDAFAPTFREHNRPSWKPTNARSACWHRGFPACSMANDPIGNDGPGASSP